MKHPLLTTMLLTSVTLCAHAEVTLFGQNLKTVTRPQMRTALKAESVTPTREDSNYWVDQYDAKGLLKEATGLDIGYRDSDSRLAYAKYTFESFMDTEQVVRVAKLVSSRYGRPTAQRGNAGLGEVSYVWRNDGIEIEVSRGWPSTTTTLTYSNPPVNRGMEAEIARQRRLNEQAEAGHQKGRF